MKQFPQQKISKKKSKNKLTNSKLFTVLVNVDVSF